MSNKIVKAMDTTFLNRLDMLKVVKSVCEENSAPITSITELGSAYTQFGSMLSEIDQTINEQIAILTGIAKDKFYARSELVKQAFTVSQSLQAFAFDKKDNELEKGVHIIVSVAMLSRVELLINTCETIYNRATEHLTELADYGVNAVLLAGFANAMANFKKFSHAPDKARKEKKMYTKNLYSLMAEIINLLDRKMDRLVKVVPDTFSDFKQVYVNARNIIDRHGKARSIQAIAGTGLIEGRVCCAYDGSPVEEALVYIVELDTMVETDDEGDYYFEEVPAGTFTIKVIADTYADATREGVEVIDGAELTEDFDLEPVIQG